MQPQVLLEQDTRETKDQRWPDGWSPERTLVALQETQRERDLDQSKRWIKRSNVDSRELRIQSTRLKYKEGRTGKMCHCHGRFT